MQEVDVNDQVQPIEAVASEVISPPAPTMTLCSYCNKLTREELAQLRTPAGTATHKPIPHIAVVEKLIEASASARLAWYGRSTPSHPMV